jgi:hypothetical protein
MKKNILGLFVVLAVWMTASLACKIGPISIDLPVQQASQEPGPVDTTQAPDQQEPGETPASGQGLLASGVLIDTGDGFGISFFNTASQVITELQTPGLQYAARSSVHLAGTVSGPIMTPLVYHAWDPQSRVKININDTITVMAEQPDFYALAGAPGQSVMVYSTVTYNADYSGITSNLYFGSLEQLTGGGGLVYSESSNQSFADYPLAVNAQNNTPLGFWFSKQMYGIGDIIFPPQKGFYYYDASSNSVTTWLDDSRIPQGFSLDHIWVASNTSNNPDHSLTIYNFSNGASVYLPILPESTSGAGYAEFSPDDQYVAWMEASGFMMSDPPDFHSRVRVATNAGNALLDLTDVTFNGVAGFPVTWVQPVAWMDNQTLLVQVGGIDSGQNMVVKVNMPDGSLSPFSNGSFVGLYYP